MPAPDLRSAIVALVFGALMGLGFVRLLPDRRSVLWATGAGTATGVVTWVVGNGESALLAATSLTLGCGVAFLLLLVVPRR